MTNICHNRMKILIRAIQLAPCFVTRWAPPTLPSGARPHLRRPDQGEPAENSRSKRHSEKNRTGPIELSNASGLSELFIEPTERWHLRRVQFAWRHQFR